ncbi:MAG: hypothetical protein LUD51_00625 [Clostridia bacterium]|nr:hypothetical protein [Clostridia bacterium]
MTYLTGDFDHQIDQKSRIRIPASLKGTSDKLYFTKGTAGCIFVFTVEAFESIIGQLNQIALGDPVRQKGVRVFLKSAVLVDIDNQGRLMVPSSLRDYAKLQKDIKICGAGSHIEVWAKEVYDAFYAEEDADFDTFFNSLGI